MEQIKGLWPWLGSGDQRAVPTTVILSWVVGALAMGLGYLAGLTPADVPLGLAIALGVVAGLMSNGVYSTLKNTNRGQPTIVTRTTSTRPGAVPATSVDEKPVVARG